jgi:thymidylate synthase (FAD)
MRLILVASPQFDIENLSQFFDEEHTSWRLSSTATQAENLIEFAGRICYMSFGQNQSSKPNSEYIRHLIEMGHESVLEHATWTFLLAGVSRAFTHQLVRHRVGFSFSQLSQQYHDETQTEFIEPTGLSHYPRAREIWKSTVENTRIAYQNILAILDEASDAKDSLLNPRELRRAIRSAARSVLPNATETKIVVTANARGIRHFLKVRGTIPGDLEMRQVAAALLSEVGKQAPSLFADFRIEQLGDGPIIRHSPTNV